MVLVCGWRVLASLLALLTGLQECVSHMTCRWQHTHITVMSPVTHGVWTSLLADCREVLCICSC